MENPCNVSLSCLLQFHNVPLVTGGGLSFDYGLNKTNNDDEFYLLTRTGWDFKSVKLGLCLVTKFILSCSHTANALQEVFESYNWSRVVLAYKNRDHTEWSGDLSCNFFMSAGKF